MIRNIKAFLIPILLIYLLLACKVQFRTANLFLAGAGFLFIVWLLSHGFQKKIVAKNYINSVPKEFVYNNNTLANSHCIVRYFPNDKIVVMDNPVNKSQKQLRSFTVDYSNNPDVNSCWMDVCSVFDNYTYLDTLFSFIDKSSGSLNLVFLNQYEDNNAKIRGMEDFIPKPVKKKAPVPKINNEHLAKKISQSAQKKQIVVDFTDLQQHEIKSDVAEKTYDNVVEMNDLMVGDKIDVNLANVQIISTLPGINIVMAKRIVEYRNVNGFFATKDDFINVSGVNEHFREKIFDLISVEKSNTAKNVNTSYNEEDERRVD